MNQERTLALIKPDAVTQGFSGPIIELIERNGFTIVALEKRHIDTSFARTFYEMHAARPFFGELVSFITSGPLVAMVLERTDAVNAWRELMGATNPREARIGSLRAMYGQDIGKNGMHGSDSSASAAREIGLFFPRLSQETR